MIQLGKRPIFFGGHALVERFLWGILSLADLRGRARLQDMFNMGRGSGDAWRERFLTAHFAATNFSCVLGSYSEFMSAVLAWENDSFFGW